jgi:hypothetical protein
MSNIKSFDSFNEEKNWIKDAVKKPGSLRKSLGKKKGEKISKSEINSEISDLRKKDRNPDKPGLQLGKRDKTKYKRLTLARTLKSMHEDIDHDNPNLDGGPIDPEVVPSNNIISNFDDFNTNNQDGFMSNETECDTCGETDIEDIHTGGFEDENSDDEFIADEDDEMGIEMDEEDEFEDEMTEDDQEYFDEEEYDNQIEPNNDFDEEELFRREQEIDQDQEEDPYDVDTLEFDRESKISNFKNFKRY